MVGWRSNNLKDRRIDRYIVEKAKFTACELSDLQQRIKVDDNNKEKTSFSREGEHKIGLDRRRDQHRYCAEIYNTNSNQLKLLGQDLSTIITL